MAIDYKSLPVYEQKQKILDCLEKNQVVIVESPTGSGKTTQIPVILYEAGYATNGVIAVTQPRRIAALSVSEFISKQLGTSYPGLVGYKMRFEDKTDASTKIKIMTDGILLQEMKLDPWLSKYSVIMVDEAHERSLNIDFVMGLLKRVLKERKDFRVIVSSATMNTQVFSEYFDNAPIVSIDTITYPVSVIYDPIPGGVTTTTDAGCDLLLSKICNTVERVLDNGDEGGILIFLPGEKIIKDCLDRLYRMPFSRHLHILPLYGRLSKEEQEKVFDEPPAGKKKVIISTNIAETSVTISDITTVIDSGLCKLNFYNPRNFTSSLIESSVSKASCNQRKGRAGRTHEGSCYRLYKRMDFETRPEYTTEEIVQNLKIGVIDCGILATPLVDTAINEQPLFYESFVGYVSKNSKLFKKKAIDAQDFEEENIWLLNEGHCMRSQVLNICRNTKNNKHQALTYNTGSVETLIRMVDVNDGTTLLPELSLHDLNTKQMNKVRYFKSPEPVREISLVTHKNFIKKKMLNALKEEVLALVPKGMKNRKKKDVVGI